MRRELSRRKGAAATQARFQMTSDFLLGKYAEIVMRVRAGTITAAVAENSIRQKMKCSGEKWQGWEDAENGPRPDTLRKILRKLAKATLDQK